MKRLTLPISLLLFCLVAAAGLRAQPIVNMGTANNTTVSTCNATFVDNGGVSGNYGTNLTQTVTFCSSGGANPTHIRLDFDPPALGSGDALFFYDGPNTAAPQITCYGTGGGCALTATGAFSVQATAANPGGCLTVVFVTDAVTSAAENGFQAHVSCVASCQQIVAQLASAIPTPVPAQNGYINLCQGSGATFTGNGLYPQNGVVYQHSNATSTFTWDFGDGTSAQGVTASHVYNKGGGYFVNLTITDQFGCKNTNYIKQRVRVAGKPIFTGTGSSLGIICEGDTTALSATVGSSTSQQQSFQPPLVSGDSLFIPDNQSIPYTANIHVNAFNPGQTLNSLSDLLGICVDMEHSYMGDLDIKIVCPNGQNVQLKEYPGGGNTYIGQPLDDEAQPNVRGNCFHYCWTPTATATWVNAVHPSLPSPFPSPPTTSPNATLVPGNYASFQSLSGLIGCPLNGIWQLVVQDHLAIDNGYVCGWQLNFAQSLFPSVEVFTPNIITQGWSPDPTIVATSGANLSVSPKTAGTYSYKYTVSDNFGCTWDTSVIVTVRPRNNPACFTCKVKPNTALHDTSICTGAPLSLDGTAVGGLGAIQTTFANTLDFKLNKNQPNNPIFSPVTVSDVRPTIIAAGSIDKVCMNITQKYDSDLDIYLIAPDGTAMKLAASVGGNGHNFTNTCFKPTATTGIAAGTAPFSAAAGYLPQTSFTTLNGKNANGVWKLRVTDHAGGNIVGTLLDWSMTFNNVYTTNYSWTKNPNTGGLTPTTAAVTTATPAGLTHYTVSVTDNYGCSGSKTITVTPAASLPAPTVSCGGQTPTSLTFNWTAVGGATSYQVSLDNGVTWVSPSSGATGTSHTITGLMNGSSATIQVRGVGNCVASVATLTCTVVSCSIIANATTTPANCNGNADGKVTATQSGGTGVVTYKISTTPTQLTNTTGVFNGLAAGSYTVTATDANGCLGSTTVVVTEPTPLSITTVSTNATCNNATNGSVCATPTGGTPAYTYTWSTVPPQTTTCATGLGANVYDVTITDAKGCTATSTGSVTEPFQLVAAPVATEPQCFGTATGILSATASGGTVGAGYTFSWGVGSSPNNATTNNIAQGTYTVTVTDTHSCVTTASVVMAQPTQLAAAVIVKAVKCFGGNNGSLLATATGGSPNYTYLWDTGAATTALSNLAIGTHSLTVTDAHGCTDIATGIVTQPTALTATTTPQKTKCFGSTDGKIATTPTGGVAPYTYLWNTSQTDSLSLGFAAGTYTVTVRDTNNCSVTAMAVVTQPTAIAIAMTTTPATCFNQLSGTATATPTGGNGTTPATYTYLWTNSGASVTPTITGLLAGVYSVTATDALGCTGSSSVTVTQPTQLLVTTTSVAPSCANTTDGKIIVVANGGTPTYTYSLGGNPPVLTDTLKNIAAGVYGVVVTDANGCTATATAAVATPAAISVAATSLAVSCHGGSNGTINVTAIGGAGSFAYSLDGITYQAAAAFSSNITATQYTVTVKDGNGCMNTTLVSVSEPPALTFTASPSPTNCSNTNNGSITIVATGGNNGYQYSIDNGTTYSSSSVFTNVGSGNYTVKVKDSKGCIDSVATTVTSPVAVVASASQTPTLCNGGLNGTITVIAGGGAGGFSYKTVLSGTLVTQNTNVFNGVEAGTYIVTVTDANGCTATATATVTEPTAIVATGAVTNVKCNGANDGRVTITASGGTGTLKYTILGAPGLSNDFSNLGAGIYTVTVVDANGCSITVKDTITEPTAIQVQATASPALCAGGSSGSILLAASGGSPNYMYSIGGAAQSTPFFGALSANTYIAVVTDTHNCTAATNVTITQPPILNAGANGNTVTCANSTNGQVTVVALGGKGALTYSIDGTFGNVSIFTGLAPGTYTVTVQDANGCQAVASAVVTAPAPITVQTVSISTLCNGSSNGAINIIASGGTGVLLYSIDGVTFQPQSQFPNLVATNYTVTVKDANLCSNSTLVTVTQPLPLIVSTTTTDVSCYHGFNGTATATANGGTGNFLYAWNDALSQNTPTANNLPIGVYIVTVTDANNCSTTALAGITEPTELILVTTKLRDVSCANFNNGAAFATATGGTSPYLYTWSGGTTLTSDTAKTLKAGVYFVTTTDGHGCTVSATISIQEPLQLSATFSSTAAKCKGDASGSCTLFVQGGVQNYSYNWGPDAQFATTPTALNLKAGIYTPTVTDANGCELVKVVFVGEPPAIVNVLVAASEPRCHDGADGTASVSPPSGGVGGYTYRWSDNLSQVTVTAVGLTAGTYTVTVSDVNGCTATNSIAVLNPSAITVVDKTTTIPSCQGGHDATITVQASGGRPGPNNQYFYTWGTSPIQNGPLGTQLLPLTAYSVTATDIVGCTGSGMVSALDNISLFANISGTPVPCFGEHTGTATYTVTGATPSYVYLWSANANNQTTATATNLTAGTYGVTVTDLKGCTLSATITITQSSNLQIATTATDARCHGDTLGKVSVEADGGNLPYSYLWSDPAATTVPSLNVPLGVYTVTVTDAINCTATATAAVTEPTAITATLAPTDVTCYHAHDGKLIATALGGTPPYHYSFNGGTSFIGSAGSYGLSSGHYSVIVRDANGCKLNAGAVFIDEPQELLVDAGIDQTIELGDGTSLTAVPNINTPGTVFSWSCSPVDSVLTLPINIHAANPAVRPVGDTRYEVVIKNEKGCTARDAVMVRVNAKRRIFIANGFTPNGDGINDVFFVQGGKGATRVAILRIFDRWGELVFDNRNTPVDDPHEGWDGSFQGKPMGSGAYTYYAEVTYEDGQTITYKGTVTLLR